MTPARQGNHARRPRFSFDLQRCARIEALAAACPTQFQSPKNVGGAFFNALHLSILSILRPQQTPPPPIRLLDRTTWR